MKKSQSRESTSTSSKYSFFFILFLTGFVTAGYGTDWGTIDSYLDEDKKAEVHQEMRNHVDEMIAILNTNKRANKVQALGDLPPVNPASKLPPSILTISSEFPEYLSNLKGENGKYLSEGTINEISMDVATQLGNLALDYEEELNQAETTSELEQNYELPEGQVITVGSERFRCPEALFEPNFIGLEQEGIHKLTFNSIMKCDVDIRKDLYNNVVMSGGTTMFEGIAERMHRETKQLAPESMTIKIIFPPERK